VRPLLYNAVPAGLVFLLLSCGLPNYDVIEAPARVSTGVDNTLAFTPATGVDYYVLAYKLYWDNEYPSTDAATIGDTDTVSTGFTTLKSLGFIQMCSSASPGTTNYPGDSTSITLNATGGTVSLTFDTTTGELVLSNALTLSGGANLYRRVRKVDSSGSTSDSDIVGKSFMNGDYDYQDVDSYSAGSQTIPSDSDGIDSDVYALFKSRFIGDDTYLQHSLLVSVAVYSYSVSASATAIESVPVYLGNVEIIQQYWNGG